MNRMVNRLISNNSQQYDRQHLDSLNCKVMLQWENLLKHLGVNDYHTSDYCVISACPIHKGTNTTALNLYLEGCNSYPGNWRCNTLQCHDVFGKDIIGFTRGMLSRKQLGWSSPNDKMVSFKDTVDYLLNFLKMDYSSLPTSQSNGDQTFTNQVNNIFARSIVKPHNNVTRENIRQSLDIPAQYYIDRGYSSTILSTYDIGLCKNPKKPMYNRIVVPIYDQDYNYIGCTGRSIFEKCEQCNQYHDLKKECKYKSPKWLHNKGFQGGEHLYNYCNAKKYIQKSQIAIITEGIGDTLKLEEYGIHNSVSIFGTSLSTGQFNLLNQSGALSLIVLLDNDDAGHIGMKKIQQQCGRLYRLYFPSIHENDIGDMGTDEITSEIRPFIEKIQEEII